MIHKLKHTGQLPKTMEEFEERYGTVSHETIEQVVDEVSRRLNKINGNRLDEPIAAILAAKHSAEINQ